jgi:hypothetical protein
MLRFFKITGVAIFSYALGVTFCFISYAVPSKSKFPTDLSRVSNKTADFEAQKLSRLEEENSRLKRELQTTVPIQDKEEKHLEATILEDNVRICERICESYPSSIETFSPDLKITPEVADIFAMTSSDISQVEKALADARAELELIQSRYLTITEQTAEKTTFEIKPFTEGQAVKDHLTESITKTLGKQRAHIFLESNKEYLNDQFPGSGNRTTKLEIVLGEDPSKDWMQEETTLTYPMGGSKTRSVPLETLPPKYRNLIKIENPAER